MLTRLPILAGLSLPLLLAACATTVTPRAEIESRALLEERHIQRTIALEQNLADSSRIQDVSFPLLQAAVPFCANNVTYSIGLDLATAHDFDESYSRAVQELLGLGSQVTVIHVVRDGPAYQAGLNEADIILAINGNPLIAGANASAVFNNLLAEEMAQQDVVSLEVSRGGELLTAELKPVAVCDYGVGLILQDDLNAYADGDNVYITRRMLRFADNDKELALVIAHELAHNIMEHSDKRRQNRWFGAVLDYAARNQGWNTGGYFGELTGKSYSQDFEAEADYVGMYVLARTGMDLDGASLFWRRMAVESPAAIDSHSSSHPATAERFLSLEKTIAEIRAKQAAGLPLNPEEKNGDKDEN